MNKRERETLGHILADLIYNFDHEPPAVDAGQRILNAFPALKKQVEFFRDLVDEDNLVRTIRSAIRSHHNPTSCNRRYTDLENITCDRIGSIFSEYYWLIESGEEPDIRAMVTTIGDLQTHQVWPVLAPILESETWAQAVLNEFPEGSAEYTYLTQFNGEQL